MRAIIIGAGVFGASIAQRLAEKGVEVTVMDAGRVGGGTSSTSFAFLNSRYKFPREYHDLNARSMQVHREIREEFGGAPWLYEGGTLEWRTEADREMQRSTVERLASWGYRAEWISAGEARDLVPDLDASILGDDPVVFYADEGWVEPAAYVCAMLSLARRGRTTIMPFCPVTSVLLRGGRVYGVATADGRRHEADIVVNCAGRWADGEAFGPELAIPMAPRVGLLVYTPPLAIGLDRILDMPGCHIRPDGGGRLVVCRNDGDVPLEPDAFPDQRMAAARELTRLLTTYLTALGPIAPEAVRIGVRSIPRDGRPAVGSLPNRPGYYVVVAHSGVTLAPLLGRWAAEEILSGREKAELAPFRPARLF